MKAKNQNTQHKRQRQARERANKFEVFLFTLRGNQMK